MKYRLLLFLLALGAAGILMSAGLQVLSATEIDDIYVWKDGAYIRFNLNEITFSDNHIRIADATMSVDDIDSITFTKPTEAGVVTDTLYIYIIMARRQPSVRRM